MEAMKGILITQCVQNDFVRTLAEGEALPNLVHVGRLEAERLCGSQGALIPFLRAAHAVPPADLAIVHVVDHHDPVRHKAHFELFRPHCVIGSDGAKLVDPIEALARARPNTRLVEAGDLNDFEDSPLAGTLQELLDGRPCGDIPVGVVGVWTDAKVSFLLYDLRTRLKAAKLATCSGLTASRSIDAHFRALEHLRIVLGVEVRHSPASFLAWLAPGAPPPEAGAGGAQLSFTKPVAVPSWWTPEHVRERDALLSQFGRGRMELSPLGGGFSGAQVFIARAEGPSTPARVLKVGARDEIARERFGNERVSRVLGDVVPRLLAYREGPALAAMQVELAESDDASTRPATFKSLCEGDASPEMTAFLEAALEEVMGRALGRFYHIAEKDNADLLEAFGFTDRHGRPQFVDSVCAKAEKVATGSGFAGARECLERAGLARPWMEPAAFYRTWLPGRSLTREVFPTMVHGDLNLANILLARRPGEARPSRAWIIDFARLLRMPVLTDFAKVENDLAYILFPVRDEAELRRAAAIQEARLSSPSLEVEGIVSLAKTPEEDRHARFVRALRRVAAKVDPRGPAAMEEYRFALLRYGAHTLGFDEPNLLQRRLALYACARLAGVIAR
jgi:hypothetical protein